jgi:hypothetical protein
VTRIRSIAGPLLALGSVALTVLAIEVGFRLADFDFEFKRRAFARVPIFYRQPVVPVGPGFYRRPGPDGWRGQVIRPWARWNGCLDDVYRDEPERSIAYDSLGFRNPPDLLDWDIVVVGDSFTELGALPDEEIFTTRLGRLLGRRVKNLGVGGTGTYTQAFYLDAWGKASATTDAVLVFFEGNDFLDIVEEVRQREEHSRGVARLRLEQLPSRLDGLPNQRSFLTAAYRWVTRTPPTGIVDCSNAFFVSDDTRTPVTLEWALPPDRRHLTAELRARVADAIDTFAATATRLGLRPWLAFMPCKRRVLDGHLVPAPGHPLPALPPGTPALIAVIAREAGVHFIDLTPALRAEVEAGRLPVETWDSHLNALGAERVARTLADALRPVVNGS